MFFLISRDDLILLTQTFVVFFSKSPAFPSSNLDGNCSVFRFQPFDVSAFERRKMSKSSEPMATTDTSGFPNTNTPFIFLILSKTKTENQRMLACCTAASLQRRRHAAVSLVSDLARHADDLLGGVHVAALSHVHHGGPAGSDDSSGPGARHRRRGVDSPLPVWSHEVLVLTVLFIAVEDHRGAFGRVAVLERKGLKRWK